MDPGVYRNIAEADYHALPYVSASRLSRLAESSMLHVAYDSVQPSEPTPQMVLGTAIHAAILEPERFEATYIESPYSDFRSKDAREWRDEKTQKGHRILSSDSMATVMLAAQRVWEHPSASRLLAARTDTELTIIWDDEATALRCKARIDAVASLGDRSVLVDIKTTRSAQAVQFAKSIVNLGYHIQLAWYLRALAQSGFSDVNDALIIAVENEPPCAVQVFRLGVRAIGEGHREANRLLELWRTDARYPTDVTDIDLPEWAYNKKEVTPW